MPFRDRIISLAAVITSCIFAGVAFGLAYPLTSLQFERWGEPGWMTGLAAGMPALAALVVLPAVPVLAVRFGVVPTMVGGCVLGLSGFLLMPYWMSPTGWIVLRFVMGLGLTLPWLLTETWINAVAEERIRGLAFGIYTVALFGGFGAGPFLLEGMTPGSTAPFLSGAAALILATLPLVAVKHLAPTIEEKQSGGILAMARVLPVAMIAALLAGAIEFSYMSLLPPLGVRAHLPETTVLRFVTAFVWGGVAMSLPLGWLADKMDRTKLFLWLCLIAIGLSAALAATLQHQPDLALAATFALGGIACAFYPTGLAILGERTRLGDLAAANAAFLVLYQVGTLMGPPVAGAAMDAFGGHGLAGAMILALVATIAAVLAHSRRATPK